MNDKIEIISMIKKEKLDEINYLKSILDEAVNVGLLMESDMNDLNIQILELLDKIVYRYNGIDSTSIKKEILEEINTSNIYTIGVYLKSFYNPDEAIKELKNNGMIYAYEEGRKKIYSILNKAKLMYLNVKRSMLDINNEIYNETVYGGIKGFFKVYNPDFKAYDMKITADYPIYNNIIGKLEGIEFIKKYLESIYIENQFCKKFDIAKIKDLLKTYLLDYDAMVINIFEIVLLEVFACKLVKRDVYDLIISKNELESINKLFENKTESEIDEIINDAYEKIKDELLKEKPQSQGYIEENLNEIRFVIKNALKNESLKNVFIVQKFI